MTPLFGFWVTEDEAKRNVRRLSGRQQQRGAIARALASDAKILLADEPTGSLDEETASEITEVVAKCAREAGKCVIVVAHSPALAGKADTVFQPRKGKLQVADPGSLHRMARQDKAKRQRPARSHTAAQRCT